MNTENVLNIYLIGASLLPVLLAVGFYLLEKKSKFPKLPYWARQVIIGVAFGILACLATQFGVKTESVVLNVRNASPLTAGLIFGGPSGIIAGFIGGLYRWISVAWIPGSAYSQFACTISTVLAGFIGATCRKFMFDNKKTSWLYGLVIGITTEVLHMMILFISKSDDVEKVFFSISQCAVPMIVATGMSLMLSTLLISLIGKDKTKGRKKQKKQITQTFSIALFVCVLISFIATSLFTYLLQDRLGYSNVDSMLTSSIDDVKSDIMDASDHNLLSLTGYIKKEIEDTGLDRGLDHFLHPDDLQNPDFVYGDSKLGEKRDVLKDMLRRYDVAEINIINRNGVIVLSTNRNFELYNMGEDKNSQAFAFMCLLGNRYEYVQQYGPTASDPHLSRKYAGVKLTNGGFLQVGYDAKQFQNSIAEEVTIAAQNRHVGKKGDMLICKQGTFEVVSSTDESYKDAAEFLSTLQLQSRPQKTRFTFENSRGEAQFGMLENTEGYIVMATLPVREGMFHKNIALYISVFMQIIMFATLFIEIYFLIKRLVVDNIHKVNESLSQITGGNLNVQVNVRDNEEFACLSNDINSTVDALKHYIKEAEQRIDKELQFAKTIQHAALPSVFPPYPNRHDFDIFASMRTAKEVGGDFYDFYLLDNDRLGFLIADVSGKGIPAAMFMMTAKTIIKGLAETGIEVDEIFTRANAELCDGNDAGMFVTAWIGIVDLRTGMLHFANAGHNPPLVRHQNGEFAYLRTRPNLVLAGMDGAKYKKQELQLLPGDEIYLYTDGVTEATDSHNELFGDDRLLAAVNENPCEGVTQRLATVQKAIDAFVGEADQFDDITMLSVKFKFFKQENGIITDSSAASMEQVCDFIDEKIKTEHLPMKLSSKVHIIVDEIYSNILFYSGATRAELLCKADETKLQMEFIDNGKAYNPLTDAKTPDITLSAEEREIGGLGIFMVKKMAKELSYERQGEENHLTVVLAVS